MSMIRNLGGDVGGLSICLVCGKLGVQIQVNRQKKILVVSETYSQIFHSQLNALQQGMSQFLRDDHKTTCSSSPGMVTSPYERKHSERDVKQQ